MIGFPTGVLLSEEECYEYLKRSLHPEGPSCREGHDLPDDQALLRLPTSTDPRLPLPRMRSRLQASPPIRCGRKRTTTHGQPVMLLRGFAKGVPTGHPTDEMDLAYPIGAEASPPYSGSSRSGRAGWTSGGSFRRIAGSRGRSRRNVPRRNFCGCGGKNPIRTWV